MNTSRSMTESTIQRTDTASTLQRSNQESMLQRSESDEDIFNDILMSQKVLEEQLQIPPEKETKKLMQFSPVPINAIEQHIEDIINDENSTEYKVILSFDKRNVTVLISAN